MKISPIVKVPSKRNGVGIMLPISLILACSGPGKAFHVKDKKQQMPTPNRYIYDSTKRTPPYEGVHLCHVYIHDG